MESNNPNILIIGGGAAGFFTAINLAEQRPDLSITILERGKDVLQKVRISGGGRCNVTHAEFDPRPLTTNYPRGEKELLGPFHKFMTGDTIAWFADRGVELKIEDDGRMFPTTDSSQTIIDCFLGLADRLNIKVLTSQNVIAIKKEESWNIATKTSEFTCDQLVVTAGSSPKIWEMMKSLDHTIVDAVPSLFTFNLADKAITDLAGIALEARVEIPSLKLESQGPLLITHWGFSGPAILKMSAWGAVQLHGSQYKFDVVINWLNYLSYEDCYELLLKQREQSKKQLSNDKPFDLPKRLWSYLIESLDLSDKTWADCSNAKLQQLAKTLTASVFKIDGKSTFKEEFVTAGGIDLKEVDFRTFGSKKQDNLYFAGEILNIDAITGGFNFQNAWTGGWTVAQAIAIK
ncbi:BaiN/RdsA family NAD(P)/FAD-dependent oxidoreductase [Nonlabens ponticola]|uniref:NAD(P)/FAD-dependent oxidoreductase n=1 Tax=Nonlabens ponticola TaxID=2496866 RepID=A0A3S9MUD0_9FLAO|nr:NAD(P)/FAD-dependent oxidoreductase [Nonlabens ponticola]AZQ42763.1 NAD(P)/FAD-dependent oxidoreductase [Nonlabens ponticola]